MIETRLAELLRDASAEPPPSKMIDLARARTDGVRALRHRQTVRCVAAGIAATVVIGAGFVVASAGNAGQPRTGAVGSAASSPGRMAPSATAAPVAPDHFDALRLQITADWIPDGMPDTTVETYVHKQILTYVRMSPPDATGSQVAIQQVTITVYAAGVTPETHGRAGSKTAQPQPGPAIDGSPSTWNSEARLLTWQWAPRAWATVLVSGNFAQPVEDVAGRVAAGVRTDVDQPVAMPFTVSAPPAPLRLVGAQVARYGADRFDAHLFFSDRDDLTDPVSGVPRMLDVAVSANPRLTGDGKVGQLNTQLNGHPAIVDFDANFGRVLQMGVNGTWVDVLVYDPVTMRYIDRSAAIALAQGINVVSRPADQSSWTSSPIR